ncbi:MAG: crossover junction endodeoxyribonuclease RuvC [Kiritimatiellia bacterium]|nr:crossover junction endodeoxyribonuclease RuvC [Kiritimatiellia bacterium]
MARIVNDRIMGMDMSLRSSGIAVIESAGSVLKTVEYRVLKNPPTRSVSECLLHIFRGVLDMLERCRPPAAAIEGIFFCKNFKTAVALGQARGAAIAACATAGVLLYEYPPRRVKQAVVGYGAASKEQVKRMVMLILRLTAEPPSDAADALAIAICHAHNNKRLQLLNSKQL